MKNLGPFGPQQILAFLPHRYPFLFVDRIESLYPGLDKSGEITPVGTKVVGYKAATFNEPYFTGHFPGQPITPGVILVETMAQVASFTLWPWVKGESDAKQSYEMRLVGVDKVRFRKPVIPGDSLKIEATVVKYRNPLWAFHCKMFSLADSSVVAEGDLLASIVISQRKL